MKLLLAMGTALSRHEIRTETDRYGGWPGQALGERFDRCALHDVTLGSEPVPLGLPERARARIKRTRAGA